MSKTKSIYAGIDCLLDTRLGTLVKINSDFAYAVTSKEDYYKRTEDLFSDDLFGELSKEIFNSVKDKYKNTIIRSSLKTKLHIFIYELFNTIIKKSIDGPIGVRLELVVNVFPYSFNNEELNYIRAAISESLNNEFNVVMINVSLKDLTCNYVKDNYSAIFMYDYGDWLDMHYRDIQKRKLKDVVLYAPELNFVRKMNDEERALFAERNMSIFDFMTMLFCDFIKIEFLPICLYSAATPANIW